MPCQQQGEINARLTLPKYPRRMANRSNRLACAEHRVDQCDGRCVLGRISQRAMFAGVKHSIEVERGNARQLDGACQRGLRRRVGLEAARELCLGKSVVAFRVQQWLAPRGDASVICASASLKTSYGAANSSSQKPVFLPVSPSSACDVSTSRISFESLDQSLELPSK